MLPSEMSLNGSESGFVSRAGDEFHASGSSKEVLNRKDEHPEEER
jgi:hypothetical protein